MLLVQVCGSRSGRDTVGAAEKRDGGCHGKERGAAEKLSARPHPQSRSAKNEAVKRENMLEAVAEVARCIPPSDFEILELARSIEANRNELSRAKILCTFEGA